MAIRTDIPAYIDSEPFVVEASLTDDDGVPITSGSMTLKVARSDGGTAIQSTLGNHSGDGVWQFDCGQISTENAYSRLAYQISDSESYVLAFGRIDILPSIS